MENKEVIYKQKIKENINNVISSGRFPELGKHYAGKVRDVHFSGENTGDKVFMIASDRISSFDHVLDKCIPFKGIVLNKLNKWAMDNTKDIIKNASFPSPHESLIVQKKCENIMVECVVRGYVWGSLAGEYEKGKRELCGINFPEGLIRYQELEQPIFTPTTKSEHDEPMTFKEVEEKLGINLANKVKEISINLYKRGQELAKKRGLIFIDTKYEFGLDENQDLVLIDEANTPDSSRYCSETEYKKFDEINILMKSGLYPSVSDLLKDRPELKIKELSKQFVRDVLVEKGFSYGSSGEPPSLTEEEVIEVSYRYIKLYENLTGEYFSFPEGNILESLKETITKTQNPERLTIGCIGGGQLLRMMGEAIQEKNLAYDLIALDPTDKCPASPYLKKQIIGSLVDKIKIKELASQCDLLTYELEHTNSEALKEIEQEGKKVYPSPHALSIIQDKFKQKSFFKENHLPVPEFIEINSRQDLIEGISRFGFPCLLKMRFGSYDGKGNQLIEDESQIEECFNYFEGKKVMLEKYVDFKKEISVTIAQSTNGEIKTYDPNENYHKDNILIETRVPARITESASSKSKELALEVIKKLNGIGVFCVEMFLDSNDNILINEVAPRVHNSGHHTIESSTTSQFEQHIRAITGMPLGETTLKSPATMINILGPKEFNGQYQLELSENLKNKDNAFPHIYGKHESKPKRKMGHITILEETNKEEVLANLSLTHKEKIDLPLIEIRTGSDSDLPKIKDCFTTLDSLGLKYEVRILSAHRTPNIMVEEAKNLANNGFKVSIGAAGGSAHLPGMTASETEVPVISLPVKTSNLEGTDSLYSMVQMPPGIPTGCVNIGDAKNAAILAAQISSLDNPEVREKLCNLKEINFINSKPAKKVAILYSQKEDTSKNYTESLKLLKNLDIEHSESEFSEESLEQIRRDGTTAIIALTSEEEEEEFSLGQKICSKTEIPVIVVPVHKEKINEEIFEKAIGEKPLACMGINRHTNASLYAAQIVGNYFPEVREKFQTYKTDLFKTVREKDSKLKEIGIKDYLEEMENPKPEGITYKDSGVNIELGDDISKTLYQAAKQTWKNRQGDLGEVIVPFDDFSGVRAIDVSNLPQGTLMNIGFDGVGTKMELAERLKDHTTIAHDLFAMVCDDAVVRGAEPILLGSILDVNSLEGSHGSFTKEINELAQGYVKAASEANVAVVNGELAELGNRIGGYGEFNYNWGASVVWFARKDRLFTGKEIKEGDYIIGLEEKGFRSNGLSLVRKIMEKNHGEEWHNTLWKDEATKMGSLVLTPSKIYTKTLVEMFGGFNKIPKTKVHGVAHITGGGLPGKLGRVLKPSGLGAQIHEPFNPSEFVKHIQKLGSVPDKEAYKTWNMGQGMVVITPEPEKAISIAAENNINAKIIGQVTKENKIQIKNKGAFSQGENLIFDIE